MGFVVFSCVCMSTTLIGPLLHLLSLPLFCLGVCLSSPLPSPPSPSLLLFLFLSWASTNANDLSEVGIWTQIFMIVCQALDWDMVPALKLEAAVVGGLLAALLRAGSGFWSAFLLSIFMSVFDCFSLNTFIFFYLRQKYLSGLIP